MSGIHGSKLALGVILMVTFLIVLIGIFMPLFDGDNALNALDNLYNSISKASAYYIPKVRHQVDDYQGGPVTLNLAFDEPLMAQRAAVLIESSAAEVTVDGSSAEVSGDLVVLLTACLEDAEAAYRNRGDELAQLRGMEARQVMHGWWEILKAAERDLNRQKRFEAASLVATVNTKTVECAYNYYGIEPQAISERWGIVVFSLVFYVIYTVWYGYAVMYLFEGLGYQLSAH
jgi:hypothetical protein